MAKVAGIEDGKWNSARTTARHHACCRQRVSQTAAPLSPAVCLQFWVIQRHRNRDPPSLRVRFHFTRETLKLREKGKNNPTQKAILWKCEDWRAYLCGRKKPGKGRMELGFSREASAAAKFSNCGLSRPLQPSTSLHGGFHKERKKASTGVEGKESTTGVPTWIPLLLCQLGREICSTSCCA